MIFPFYNDDILRIQYKTIELMDESVVFADNSRKRKRFNTFIQQIISKNNDFLMQMKQQDEEDDNIQNYEEYSTKDFIITDEESDTSSETCEEETECEQETECEEENGCDAEKYDETIVEKKNV